MTGWELAAQGSLIRGGMARWSLIFPHFCWRRASRPCLPLSALGATDQLTDSFLYAIQVGNGTLSYARVTVTITGENDVATINGDTTATLRATDTAPVTRTLVITDADRGESAAQVVTGATSISGYGISSVTADATWSFTIGPAVVAHLASGTVVTDSFIAGSRDGSAEQEVVVTIEGVDDAPTTPRRRFW